MAQNHPACLLEMKKPGNSRHSKTETEESIVAMSSPAIFFTFRSLRVAAVSVRGRRKEQVRPG